MSSVRGIDRARGDKTGFTVLGMIVALMLLGLLLSPLLGTILSAQNGFVASRERARAAGNVRYAQLSLTRFMRLAGSSPVGLPLPGIDPDPDGNGVFDDVRLRADYNPPDGDTDDMGEDMVFYIRQDTMFVKAGPGGSEEPYLIGVDSLAFEYFDRDGVPITDRDMVATRTIAARVTIRARGERSYMPVKRVLTGQVRLRNGK